MPEFIQTTIDKFTFKVATDRYYSDEGVWALPEGNSIRIGFSDFLQQRNGDVAFAEIQPERTILKAGEEIAIIETIKVNISLTSPVSGEIITVNPAMEAEPELINMDPYGTGWVAVIRAKDWEFDRTSLLDSQTYLALIRQQAEEETMKS